MTEIVGGRQRLTEDDIREAIVATMTFREALAELAPSRVPVDELAAFYRRAAAAEIVRAWLARPQEQPHAAAHGWQTMETAPKDGTRVLLWMVHDNRKWGKADEWEAPVVAYWTHHNKGGWVWHGMAGQPTHWMPSPAAPPSPQEQEKARG